ncbi:MAG: hypothetical protein LBG95_07185 [Treponema sp.]|jgi:hypothetical protein|nr:hypothetical protein [Treponema sp.]
MKNLAKKMKKRIAPVIIAAMCAGTAAGIMSCDTGTGGTTGNGNEYDKDGFDKDGYDRNGYDRDGYNRNGYDAEGYNREGYNQNGEKRPNGSGEYLADPVEDIKFVVFDDETVSSVESEVRRKRGQFINQSETIKTQYSRWKAELMTQGTDGNDPRMKFADNMEAEEGRLIRYLGGAAGGGGYMGAPRI